MACLFLAATWRYEPRCSQCGLQLGDIHADLDAARVYCRECCPDHGPKVTHDWKSEPAATQGKPEQGRLF